MTERITPRQFHEADGVEDWRVVGEGACTYFRTGSFAAGARLVDAISELVVLDDHHPDVDLRYGGVTVRLITITHDYYGLRKRDVELARQISAVARELGVPADPSAVQTVQVSIDALVGPEVLPFWRAVLGYRDRGDSPEDLIDPRPRGAVLVPADGRAAPAAQPDPHRRLGAARSGRGPRRGGDRRRATW
jgi:4a-hydroxytetrahydrobiopterin dehydratase